MECQVLPVEQHHIEHVAKHMRMQDQHEIWAQSLSRPLSSLKYCVTRSQKSWCSLVDDEPFAIFGVTDYSLIGAVGSPWLLGTDRVRDVPFQFLRGCKKYVDDMIDGYERLENYVDARNTVSIAWLKWMGFDILEQEPYGVFKFPFHKFTMENANV